MMKLVQSELTLGIIDPSDFSKKLVSGGSSGFLSNVIPHLKAKRVIIFGIGLDDVIPWKTFYLQPNVEFVPICSLRFFSRIPMRFKVLFYYMRYRGKILRSGVDVLYVQMPECCLPFLKNRKNIPVIYQKHGSENPVAKSKFTYGRTIVFRKFYEYVLQLIYKNAQWIIAIDRLTHKEIIKRGGKKRSSLLMNAVDMNKFFPNDVQRNHAREHYALKKYDNAILFVGRIEKTKGPKLLVDCIHWLKNKQYPFHIFFAGEGTYKTYLENYVMRMNYNSIVTFLGHVPHEDLPILYNMSDALVLPSETEGAPMVILESLACGTPVVASNVGGIPDIVADGINGIVLKDLSPEHLATGIITVLINKLSRQEISESIKTFSASSFVDSLDIIIANVLQKNNL